MKKIILALLILLSFASCKKELNDTYKINFFTDKSAMEISYNDYAGVYKDTTIKASNYSVEFISFRSIGVGTWINGGSSDCNLHIQIYKNNKLVIDSTNNTTNFVINYFK